MTIPTSEPPQGDASEANLANADPSQPPSERVNPALANPARAERTEAEKAADPREDRYECRSCGYMYEPLKGDDSRGISPDTAFTELDSDWRCPVCRAPKVQFSNVGPKGKASGFEENLGYGLGVNTLTPGQKNILIFGALALAFLFFMSLYGLG